MVAPVSDRLAVDGGPPVRAAPFPVLAPPPPAEDGRPIEALERELAGFLGGERVVVACAGHVQALALACRVAGVEEGEVVLPALAAGPVARGLLTAGLHPVPADVDAQTGNLTVRSALPAGGDRTRALLVTHAFGHPAPMAGLLQFAEQARLAVIEDLSGALGAAYDGGPAGTLGHVAVLGFGAGHLLTGGDDGGRGGEGEGDGGGGGGAVIVQDERTAARVRGWREQASEQPAEASVRVALAELRRAERQLQLRREGAWHLTQQLRGVRGIATMAHERRVRHGYDRYVLRLRSIQWPGTVEETVERLRAEGVPCEPAAGPLLSERDDVRAALGVDDARLAPDRFTVASTQRDELLAISLDGAATSVDLDGVAAALRKLARASAEAEGTEAR